MKLTDTDVDHPVETIEIGPLSLTVRQVDVSGQRYKLPSHVEEVNSQFLPLLAQTLAPAHCIDVGANYGFTAMQMRAHFPEARLTVVEPVGWLCEMLDENFRQNGMVYDRMVRAIASDRVENAVSFGLNPVGSTDNRVIPQDQTWGLITTNSVTLNDLTSDIPDDEPVYIKIDTQGWDSLVLKGSGEFLTRHSNWVVKSEFAPWWMKTQGVDPASHLRSLAQRYRVFEHFSRTPWGLTSVDALTVRQLQPGDADAFTAYVEGLNRGGKGWGDILILPCV